MDQPYQDSCKLGLYLFQEEGWMGGGTAGWKDIKSMTQVAEEIGFDAIWLPDRLMRVRDGKQQGLWEAFTMLAAMAAVTSRIELGHAVLRSIYRNPALLVRMVETIEEISDGRFTLGLGIGAKVLKDADEPAFGFPQDSRYSRFCEALDIMLALFKDVRVDFNGKFYSAKGCVNRPRGPRRGKPPIFIAAAGPKMMRLAAKHADIWGVPIPALSPKAYEQFEEPLTAACAEVGRDPSTLTRMAVVNVDPRPNGQPEGNPYGESLIGSPDKIAHTLRAIPAAGYSHVVLVPYPNTPESVEACAPVIDAFKSMG